MNKLITIGSTAIVTLAIPTLAFTITPTRNAILSMAPDEQILTLADKIDEQRVSADESKAANDAKLAEFQSTIDAQQAKLAEQQKLIDEQKNDISSAKEASQVAVATVSKQKDCSVDMNKYCVSDSFTDPVKFKSFLKNYEEDFTKDEYENYKQEFTQQFNSCQKALKCE